MKVSQTKVCRDCMTEKPISEFYKARGVPINPCKACRSKQQRSGGKMKWAGLRVSQRAIINK